MFYLLLAINIFGFCGVSYRRVYFHVPSVPDSDDEYEGDDDQVNETVPTKNLPQLTDKAHGPNDKTNKKKQKTKSNGNHSKKNR